MVRLTGELLAKCPQYVNPLSEREVDIRGYKIAEIENLGILNNGVDSIDFSDNEVTIIGNFPLMPRCRTLIAHNNRINKISPALGESLSGLKDLVMHNNNLVQLESLAPLADIPTLERLSLIGNAVTQVDGYREFVIARVPSLKVLDFQKIRPVEREESLKRFPTKETTTPVQKKSLDDEGRRRIAELVKSATSLEEIRAIESNLPPVN